MSEEKPQQSKGSSEKACVLAVTLILLLIGFVTIGGRYAYDQWVVPTMEKFTPQVDEAKRQIEKSKEYYEEYQKLKDSGLIEDAENMYGDYQNYKNE